MARFKSLLAIFLALTLLISPTIVFPAGGGNPPTEGHPWDDGDGDGSNSGTGTDPGSNTPEQGTVTGSPTVDPMTPTTAGSGSYMIARLTRLFVDSWTKVFGSTSVRVAARRNR